MLFDPIGREGEKGLEVVDMRVDAFGYAANWPVHDDFGIGRSWQIERKGRRLMFFEY